MKKVQIIQTWLQGRSFVLEDSIWIQKERSKTRRPPALGVLLDASDCINAQVQPS